MSLMDNIFDIRALVKKHGDNEDKKAWENIEKHMFYLEAEDENYNKLSNGLMNVMETLINKFPEQSRAIIARANIKGK